MSFGIPTVDAHVFATRHCLIIFEHCVEAGEKLDIGIENEGLKLKLLMESRSEGKTWRLCIVGRRRCTLILNHLPALRLHICQHLSGHGRQVGHMGAHHKVEVVFDLGNLEVGIELIAFFIVPGLVILRIGSLPAADEDIPLLGGSVHVHRSGAVEHTAHAHIEVDAKVEGFGYEVDGDVELAGDAGSFAVVERLHGIAAAVHAHFFDPVASGKGHPESEVAIEGRGRRIASRQAKDHRGRKTLLALLRGVKQS